MKVGFYAGSFDPFTVGHLHVVKKASELFDEVIVGIGINAGKKSRYDKEKMKNAINACLLSNGLNNCRCVIFDGLTADVAKTYNASFLIRGIRNGMDYEFEENLALINEELSDIDTIYIRAGKYGMVSSSMVYELIKRNKSVSKYLPKEVEEIVNNSEN